MALLKFQDLTQKTQERIGRLKNEIGFYDNSILFWESLDEKDKTKLRKTIDNQKHLPRNNTLPNATTLQMWTILTKEPEIVGVIQIAFQIEIISQSDRDELLQKIGYNASSGKVENQKKLAKEDKPFWNHKEGHLYFCGEVILKTQRRKEPSNMQIILQEFQKEGWLDEIKTPSLPEGFGIADTVCYLNRKTKGIKLTVVAGGNYLSWIANKTKK